MVSTLDGVKGVIVPAEDPVDAPWFVEYRAGQRNEKDEEEDVGSDGGDEETAGTRFAGNVKHEKESFASLAQGAVQSILDTFALTEPEKAQAASVRKIKKKRKAKDQSGGFRPRLFGAARSDDESGEAPGTTKATSKAKAALAPGKCAGATSALKLSTAGCPTSGAGNVDPEPAEGSAKRQKGNPGKDVLALAQQIWTEFNVAEDGSKYFCKTSDVQGRLVVRWANTARSKGASSSDPNVKMRYDLVAKQLQVVESTIKLHRAWLHRTCETSKALMTFNTDFKVLTSFAESEPCVPFECEFIWDLRLQLLAIQIAARTSLNFRSSVTGTLSGEFGCVRWSDLNKFYFSCKTFSP